MAERLASARLTFADATDSLADALENLATREERYRTATSAGVSPGRAVKRLRSQVASARSKVDSAVKLKRAAAAHLVQAQADYDSTREGLQDLRVELDRSPGSQSLARRYMEASRVYESEAAQREVAFGAQAPLSRTGLDDSGVIGRRMSDLGATAWLKAAAAPDVRTGNWAHKVNFVWREQGSRKSITVPTLSTTGIERVPGEPLLRGEPTMAAVCDSLDDQCRTVSRMPTYGEWLESRGEKNTLARRQTWRAMLSARTALSNALPVDDLLR